LVAAAPILIVIFMSERAAPILQLATFSRRRSPTAQACSMSVSGSNITNSSPPMRQNIRRPFTFTGELGYVRDRLVTGVVSELIVDELEMIDIHQ
jgi:hypothetical protein